MRTTLRHNRVLWALLMAMLSTGGAACALAQQAQPSSAQKPVVAVIPVADLIDQGLYDSLVRRIAEARVEDPVLLVFEIDTHGGLLDPAMEIADLIGSVESPRTVAFIPEKAYSAGAMIAVAASEIVLTPRSSIGDAAPIAYLPGSSDGPEILGEKFQSPIRGLFRKYAQQNGYPEALLEAMVTPELEVVQVKYKDGSVAYMLSNEYEDLGEAEKEKVEETKTVVREGEVLTLTASEAVEYGVARFVVRDLGELLEKHDLSGAKVVTFRVNWSEWLVRKLNHPAVAGLLLMVGLVALYMEFKVPGFGLPGTVAIICFATYFFSKYLSGLAVNWEILIFVIGLALLAIEIFLIPGFGITGFLGVSLMVLGLALAFLPQHLTGAPIDTDFLVRSSVYFILALVGAFLLGAALAKLLPHAPVVGKFYLGVPEPASVPHAEAAGLTEGARDLIGKFGKSVTILRPAGRALIGGQYYDVTTEGDLVRKDSAIEVVAVRGNNIIVREAK